MEESGEKQDLAFYMRPDSDLCQALYSLPSRENWLILRLRPLENINPAYLT
jgi:hypothetical protein